MAAGIGLRAEMAAEIVVAAGVRVAEVDGVAGAVDVLAAAVVVGIAVAVVVRVVVAAAVAGTNLFCQGYSRITRINQAGRLGRAATIVAALFFGPI